MKLKEFKKCIDKGVKYAGTCDPEIEFYIGEKLYEIKEIGQNVLIPDVIINLKKPLTKSKREKH
jgi:hypothetical protein